MQGKKKLFAQMVTFGLVLFLGLIVFDSLLSPERSAAAWFNESWLYRKAIAITAHTAAENNVYINLTGAAALDTSDTTKFQGDCGDLRFTNQGGDLLQYFIVSGCGTSSTVIHVNFETFPAGAQDIYYYYGNPSAPNGFSLGGFPKAATGVTIGSLGSEEQSPSPAAYWSLDEGTGTQAKDSTSNGKNGTLTGTTLPVWTSDQCVSQKCLYFNGITSNVSISGTVAGVKTIAFWVNPSSSSSAALMALNSTTDVRLTSGTVTAPGTTSPVIYINATQSAALQVNRWQYVTITTSTAISASAITLGKGPLGILKGYLDEVKLYPFVLSADQIKANFASRGSAQGSSNVLGQKDQKYLSSGLVGYWKMDETAANTCTLGSNDNCDSSGNANDGAWNGSATASTSAKFGAGTTFDGSGDYAQVTHSNVFNFSQDFTVSTWVKLRTMPTSGNNVKLVYKNKATSPFETFEIGFDGDNGFFFQVPNTNASYYYAYSYPASQFSTNTWYLVTGVKSGNAIKLYVNGVGYTDDIFTGSLATSTDLLYFGGVTASNFLDGVMDDVRLYNRAFSTDEVQKLYDFAPGPVGYWDFEEKQGTSTADRSGYGNNGTLTNAPSWVRGKYGSGLTFDGARSGGIATYVDLGDDTDFERTQFTIGAWVYRTGTCGTFTDCSVFSKGSTGSIGYAMEVNSVDCGGYKAFLELRDTQKVCGTSTIQPNTWYYISASVDNDYIKVYVNGVLETTVTRTQTPTFSTETAKIGNRNSGLDLGFSGSIDEVRFYNYVRSTKQIVEDMNAGHPAGGSPVGSMIGYWDFDDGYGNVASNSGSLGPVLNAGMFGFASPATYGSGWANDGKFGKALNFDSSDDFVRIRDKSELDITGALTISAWIKPGASTGADECIVSKYDFGNSNRSYRFCIITSTNKLYLSLTPDGTTVTTMTAATPLSLNGSNWYHVAAVYDGTGHTYIYLNGQQDMSSTSYSSGIFSGSADFEIGSNLTSGSQANKFNGTIDEVKLYNYALTASEVKIDMNQGKSLVLGAFGMNSSGVASNSANAAYCVPGDTTQACSPFAEYRFEEHQGKNANDTSTNSYNGVLFGDPSWTTGKVGGGLLLHNSSSNADFVQISSSMLGSLRPNDSSPFSMSSWIYADKLTTGFALPIASSETYLTTGFRFYTTSTKVLRVSATQSGGTLNLSGVTPLVTGKWYYVAFTYDGTTGKLYLNGVKDNQADGTILAGANTTWLGKINGNDFYWNGKLDEFKFYNYTLSPAQVAWDYNRGKPIAAWDFDECQGGTIHDSIGATAGTINIGGSGTSSVGTCSTSSTAWGNGVSGKFNYSLDLDGTDDYVSVASPGLPTNDFTASAWVNLGTATDETILMASKTGGDELRVHVNSSGQIELYTAGVLRVTSARTVSTGSWNNIVVASSSGTQKIYINGTQDTNTGSGTTVMNFSTCAFLIGVDADSSCTGSLANYMDGQIDEVQVFNYGLTAVQIRNLYNQSAAVRFGPNTGAP